MSVACGRTGYRVRAVQGHSPARQRLRGSTGSEADSDAAGVGRYHDGVRPGPGALRPRRPATPGRRQARSTIGMATGAGSRRTVKAILVAIACAVLGAVLLGRGLLVAGAQTVEDHDLGRQHHDDVSRGHDHDGSAAAADDRRGGDRDDRGRRGDERGVQLRRVRGRRVILGHHDGRGEEEEAADESAPTTLQPSTTVPSAVARTPVPRITTTSAAVPARPPARTATPRAAPERPNRLTRARSVCAS